MPHAEKSLQVRLMVCVAADIWAFVLQYTYLERTVDGMKGDVTKFVQHRLHCTDFRAGNVVLRSLGEILHGTEVGEDFDYLKLTMDLHVLGLGDAVSSFAPLQSAASCISEVVRGALWCGCRYWVFPRCS